MVQLGYTTEDIGKIRQSLTSLSNSTDEQLKNQYRRSDRDIQLLRNALDPNAPMPRGSIPTNQLTYSSSAYAISIGKPVAYRVAVSFTWKSDPFVTLADKVVIGWGGNLATWSQSSSGTYYNPDNGAYKYLSGSPSEGPINGGYTFRFQRGSSAYILASGTTVLDLYQNQKYGIASKILTVFAHEVIAFSDAGVSISASGASISFNFGSGWDYSSQGSHSITY